MDFQIEFHEAPNGDLLLSVDSKTQMMLQVIKGIDPIAFATSVTQFDIFGWFITNTEYSWITPEEIDAFTDAPILGIKGSNEYGDVIRAWAFMDFESRSPQDDLADKGRVRFTGND
jgi:hypothetical protein